MKRRDFLATTAWAATGVVLYGCGSPTEPGGGRTTLQSRPGTPDLDIEPGLHALGLSSGRDAELYVPAAYTSGSEVPLLVALHGAGGSSTEWTASAALRAELDDFGFALLAPSSRDSTWHVGGDDVAFIDAALAWTFRRLAVDPAKVALGGFSDGASMALSLGLANGSLFGHVLGFSPGYLVQLTPQGKPRVFISHGRQDPVLSFASAEGIVDYLRGEGYAVEFVPFDGGHELPFEVAHGALGWFAA